MEDVCCDSLKRRTAATKGKKIKINFLEGHLECFVFRVFCVFTNNSVQDSYLNEIEYLGCHYAQKNMEVKV